MIALAEAVAARALLCPVCALNDATRSDAQWWAVLGAILVPFAVVVAVSVVLRRVLSEEDRAP